MTQRLPHPVMAALAVGVPLTLLVDLADPNGPDSRHINDTETADLSWLGDLAYPFPAAEPRANRAAG